MMMENEQGGEMMNFDQVKAALEKRGYAVSSFETAKDAADYLDKELGTVAHTDKVIGNADKVQHDDGAEGVCQWQRFCAYFLKQLIMSG